jgi:hypothetical protein
MRRACLFLCVAGLLAWPRSASAQLDALTNVGSCVVTGFAAGATTITVNTGCGATLPSTAFNLTVCNTTDYPIACRDATGARDPNYEVMRATAGFGTDSLTVTRAQEGTSDVAHNTGGKVYWVSTFTAKTITDINLGKFLALSVDGGLLTWDDTNNRLGMGTASPAVQLDLLADGSGYTTYATSYGATQSIYRYRRARNTLSAPRRVQTNDILGNLQFWGAQAADDSTDATFGGSTSAVIRVSALENFTSTGRGSRIEFQTTPIGGTSTGINYLAIDAAAVTIQGGPHLTLGTATRLDVAANFQAYGTDDFFFFPEQPSRPQARIQFNLGNVVAGGPDGYGNFWGGTERNQTYIGIVSQIDTSGTPSNYFNGLLDYHASDASGNLAGSYSWLNEGNWTNAGGFVLNRMALWNYNFGGGGKTVFFTQSGSSLPVFERQLLIVGGLSPSGNDGFGLRVYGFDASNDDAPDGATLGADVQNIFRTNTTTAREWNVISALATLNFGGSNTSKTINLLEADTVNTVTTGSTVNLLNLKYGSSGRLLVTSPGIVKLGGTAARGTTEGTFTYRCFNGTAPVGTLTNGGDVYCEGGEVLAMDSAGNPANLTAPFTSTVQGIVPASGGGTTNFLRADGTWAGPAGGGTVVDSGAVTDNAIARYDGTSGTDIQNSTIAISDTGALSPVTTDTGALGTTALQWSDIFLAEGGVINWDNGDATLTQAGDVVTLAGANLVVPGLTASENVALSGDISPSQLTADQNDWSPTSLATSSVIRIDTDNVRQITGIAGGADGRILTLIVLETAQGPVILRDQNTGSTAGNRFILGARRIWLWPGDIATLLYDSTSSRWRLLASPYEAGTVVDVDYQQYQEEFLSGVNGTGTATEAGETVGTWSWRSTANGTAASTSPASVAAHPGIIQLVTGSTSGNDTRLHLGNAATDDIYPFQDVRYFGFLVRTTDNTSNRIKVGLGVDLGDGTVAALGSDGIFFEFDTATNANWRTVTRAASTSTTNTSSVAITNNEWDLLEAVRLTNGNWAFVANDTVIFTHSANLPTTAMATLGVFVETQTAAARNVQLDWAMLRTARLGQRWTP